MKRITVFLVAGFFCTATMAEVTFTCSLGDAERTVSVNYPGSGPLPCEVHDNKGSGTEVLWSAEHTEGYCESRVREFIAKLGSLGYSCTENE